PASHVRYACRVNVSFLCSTSPPRDPHSFPTRRSSDLLRGTAGLQIRFSSFVEEEADVEGGPSTTSAPISPTNVLSSPLDGTSVRDRKSTRLNSSHQIISYAVSC